MLFDPPIGFCVMSDIVKVEENTSPSQGESTRNSVSGAPEISGLQILSRSGETSAADVWSALQISLERLVTIWVLKEELSQDAAQAEHFENVARAVSRIRHPNLLQVIDVARTAKGVPYVVYENVDGTSLASILHLERKIDPVRAMRIVMEIAKVLDSAWKQCGFVHRNIKPETVQIGSGDTVKLINFSSATLVKPGENPLAYDDGMVVGTPSYASPEQVECLRSLDYHSDMYSAGASFYQMVTGVTPFGDEPDPMKILELQRVGTLTNPREFNPSIKPGVVHIIRKMMAKSPEERYPWWQDVIEDLQRVLDGRPPYLESTNYVPPLSTVAPSPAEVESGTPSLKAKRRLTNVPVRKLKTYATQEGGAAPAKRKPSGPNFMMKLVAVLAVGSFAFGLTYFRINMLERPPAGDRTDAEKSVSAESPDEEAGLAVAEDAADQMEGGFGDQLSAVPDDSAGFGDSLNGEETQVSGSSLTTPVQSDNTLSAANEIGDRANGVSTVVSQQKLLSDIYKTVVSKNFEEAKAFAFERFKDSKDVAGIDTEECKLIWSAFNDACSFEDLIGVSLTRSSSTRTLSIGGKEIVFAPRMYSNGELIGTLFNEDETTVQNYRIKVAEMTPEEMYDTVLSSVVDDKRPALLSRAFLTMKMGGRGDFSILIEKYDIKELKPFLDHVGK